MRETDRLAGPSVRAVLDVGWESGRSRRHLGLAEHHRPECSRGFRLWPFDGSLATLLRENECTLAETYPAQACVQLGLPAPGRGWSKRVQADRARHEVTLRRWASSTGVHLSANLSAALKDGFGAASTGEDAFDATVGLLGMLAVVLGATRDGCPDSAAVRSVEGWILGS